MGLMLLVSIRVYLEPVGFKLGKNFEYQTLLPTFNQDLIKTRKDIEVSTAPSMVIDPSTELLGQ